VTICSYSSVTIFLFSSLIIEEKTSSLVPYDENENFVTERYYSVTKFCIVTSKMSLIRVFLLVRGEPPHREGGRCVGFGCGEFAGHSFARGQYEYGGNDRSFRSQRSYGPRSPLRGTRSPPRGRVGVPSRRDRMDFANPMFEQNGEALV
jgi:hypothetical protein